MGTTNIEWCVNEDGTKGSSVNPVKGACPMACSYCYARRLYERFGWNPAVRYTPSAVDSVMRRGKPGARVFVGSTMELFGPWVPPHVLPDLLENMVGPFPQRTFIFLTKLPGELQKYNPWPDNCWVGASATDWEGFVFAGEKLQEVESSVRFVSFEPLQGPIREATLRSLLPSLQWVIVGQETPVRKRIPVDWVMPIVDVCHAAGIPLFLKDNLQSVIGGRLCQEWPRK